MLGVWVIGLFPYYPNLNLIESLWVHPISLVAGLAWVMNAMPDRGLADDL